MQNRNSGFTLVEVLLSMLILSIIVTSATAVFTYGARVSEDNKLKMTAMNLANESVEYIRALKFADVGTKSVSGGMTIYGDPKGEILQKKSKIVDGTEYTINTVINWEEQGTWDLGDTDWDYKSVKVTVVPKGMEGDQTYTKVIETYVTRDSSQPALSGANISLRIIHGWNTSPGTVTPVPNVKILLAAGPSAPRQVLTSSAGVARFINLLPGNYMVNIDPSSLGMMLLPTQAADWPVNSLLNGTTRPNEFKVEFPCYIHITLKDLDGNPVILDPGITGELKLLTPFGSDITQNINSTDLDALGHLPLDFIPALWPVGDGYSGCYTISNLTIPECQYLGSYEVKETGEEVWSGKFDAPNTSKEITCYLGTIPVTPSGINTSWVDSFSCIITDSGSYTAMDEENENMSNGSFSTGNPADTIAMKPNTSASFNALSIYFENKGTLTDPGLFIGNQSNLILRAGKVIFRGEVEIGDSVNPDDEGRIVFFTNYDDGTEADCVDGSLIGGTPGLKYGKLYLTKPLVIGGITIVEPGGYYFYNGLTLPDNASALINITKDNYIG